MAALVVVAGLIPWALPGTVVAVSVAEAYGQPSLLLGSFVLVERSGSCRSSIFCVHAARRARVAGSMEQLDRRSRKPRARSARARGSDFCA
jgi:ABC-type Fe3+ transport system permease subunit